MKLSTYSLMGCLLWLAVANACSAASTIEATVPLEIKAVVPALGPSSGGIPIEIEGTGFVAETKVRVGEAVAPQILVQSPTRILATLPPQPGAWGVVPVTVTNPDQRTASGDLFEYYASTPKFVAGPALDLDDRPGQLAVADFNEDHKLDVAVAYTSGPYIGIWLSDGTGSFVSIRRHLINTYAQSLAIGDFNNDGHVDLAAVDSRNSSITILLGNGQGNFITDSTIPTGKSPEFAIAKDLNLDGKLDLVVANTEAQSIGIFRGDGAGHFLSNEILTVGVSPRSIAVTDFNKDSYLDIAVANGGSGTVSLLMGTNSGGFSPAPALTVGTDPIDLAVGDVNGDQNQDLVVVNQNDGVRLCLGLGTGSFAAVTKVQSGSYQTSLVLADFNGDMRLDLAVGHSEGISVSLWNGVDGFQPGTLIKLARGVHEIAVGDFNNDTIPDLTASDYQNNNIDVVIANGPGVFGASKTVAVGKTAAAVGAADFDGDKIMDLAILNKSSNAVNVLFGSPSGQFKDSAIFIAEGMPVSLEIADWNGDLKPDIVVGGKSVLGSTITFLYSNGKGQFSSKMMKIDIPLNFIAASDMNRDNQMDLIVTGDSGEIRVYLSDVQHVFRLSSIYNSLFRMPPIIADWNMDLKPDVANENSILLGDGTGGFSNINKYDSSILYPITMSASDFNGDGVADMVFSNECGADCLGSIQVLTGDGQGGLQPTNTYPAKAGWSIVTTGDFNGDHSADIAMLSKEFSLFLGDGTGGFSGPKGFLASYYNTSKAVAGDFNGDRRSDIAIIAGTMAMMMLNKSE